MQTLFKKINLSSLFLAFIVIVAFSGCKKDLLEGDLDVFQGRYTWTFSLYKDHWWSQDVKTKYASNEEYAAEIEFNDAGRVFFYIDGALIHDTRFHIEDQYFNPNGHIELRIDPVIEDTKQIDLNNNLGLTLMGDTLVVDDFPGESYDKANIGSHFFMRN